MTYLAPPSPYDLGRLLGAVLGWDSARWWWPRGSCSPYGRRRGAPCSGWGPYVLARGSRRSCDLAEHRYEALPVKGHIERSVREMERERERALVVGPTSTHLRVEVEEALLTVDVVEGCKWEGRTIHGHGVELESPSVAGKDPVRVRPTHIHLHTITPCSLERLRTVI